MDNKGPNTLKTIIIIIVLIIAVAYVVLLSVLAGKEISAGTFSIQTVAYLCIAIFLPLTFIFVVERMSKK